MVLGHLKQGANHTAYDRAHAAALAAHCIDWLTGRMLAGRHDWHYAALRDGTMGSRRIVKLPEVYDMENRRPKVQWWMPLLAVQAELSHRPAEQEQEASRRREGGA